MKKLLLVASVFAVFALAACGGAPGDDQVTDQDNLGVVFTGSGAECCTSFDCGSYETCTGVHWDHCTSEGCETIPGYCASIFGDGLDGGGGAGLESAGGDSSGFQVIGVSGF